MKKLGLLALLAASVACSAKTVIFDIHGVLLNEDISTVVKQKVAATLSKKKDDRGLRESAPFKKFCELLAVYKPMADYPSIAYPENCSLPYETYALFAGHIAPADLYERTKKMLVQAGVDGAFSSLMEQVIVASMIETVFEREQLLAAMSPLTEGVALLKHVATDATHQLAIFSNAPDEWVRLYLTHEPFAAIFSNVTTDRILTSGQINLLKPAREAYETVCKKLGCTLEDIVLIDDTAENVEQARGYGMQAIYFDPAEIDRVVDEMVSLELCSPEDGLALRTQLRASRSFESHEKPQFFVS